MEPSLLPASILKRLPIRFNYDDNYYQQTYQGIPINGYTNLVENILDHDNIKVLNEVNFSKEMTKEFDHVFYSGPLDKFFNYDEGELAYRSLMFEKFDYDGDFQGNPVINYCQESVPFTRITEHKHFAPWESHQNSICFREYSLLTTKNLDPYYPLRLLDDINVLQRYIQIIENTSKITFIGRLGTYRYLDMHVVINESLKLAEYCLSNCIQNWPKFSVKPL